MLFNSYIYLLIFLPVVLVGYQALRRAPLRVGLGWLVLASLVYFGWWKPSPDEPWTPRYLALILGSCVANYFVGRLISGRRGRPAGRAALATGVTANLLLLGYFKYAGLFDKTLAALTGNGLDLPDIVLPLGISFFTFQQVAYLVDAWRGETEEYHFIDYLLFVTFFPQLIAGPIVHHGEMLPQFSEKKSRGIRSLDLSVGITCLALGLFKKVVLADYLARTATPIFGLAAAGDRPLTMGEAWAGMLAYTLQIYFDFSGYSDMAIGSARLFGIRLPLNFHSPYKAASVIDFWRRWHMTLSRFLRDYLYISLGGNRKGTARRYLNLMATMLLGGLWHGAGWTFAMWGALHGFYLCVNHFWHHLRKHLDFPALPLPASGVLTFFAVALAWIPFRAGNFELGPEGSTTAALAATKSVLASMFGLHGLSGWPGDSVIVVTKSRALRPIVGGLVIVWLLPNTQQFLRRYRPALGLKPLDPWGARRWWQWRPSWPWLLFTLGLLYAVGRGFDQLSEFIYFQF
ncbi:MBOAT family O-acyltransferase [Haloferula sargassicola]|uniref:Peptidoglycan O-acetyltransferase n=1 Tax=Haloferula sargassicola TaxID=490096 RepID=A0ABP9UQZ0_9BACT